MQTWNGHLRKRRFPSSLQSLSGQGMQRRFPKMARSMTLLLCSSGGGCEEKAPPNGSQEHGKCSVEIPVFLHPLQRSSCFVMGAKMRGEHWKVRFEVCANQEASSRSSPSEAHASLVLLWTMWFHQARGLRYADSLILCAKTKKTSLLAARTE